MDSKRLRRVLLMVAGSCGVLLALFALLVVVNGAAGFIGCTGTSRAGWTFPLLAGGLIGGVAWGLLLRSPHIDESKVRHSVPCPSCDKAVMADWRLCPYCGRPLASDRIA